MISKKLKLGVGIFLLGLTMTAGTACSQKDQNTVKQQAKDAVNEATNEASNDEKTNDNKQADTKATDVKKTDDNTKKSEQSNNAYAKAYLSTIEKEKKAHSGDSDEPITCDLIYFNNDDIPDLVIGAADSWVNLYVYSNGKLYSPLNDGNGFGYGAFGNAGYTYKPKTGIIRNSSTQMDGHVLSESFSKLNKNYKLDTLSTTKKGADIDKSEPDYEEQVKSVQEILDASAGYMFNENKISEQEYNNMLNNQFEGATSEGYVDLAGKKSIDEVKKQLQK